MRTSFVITHDTDSQLACLKRINGRINTSVLRYELLEECLEHYHITVKTREGK